MKGAADALFFVSLEKIGVDLKARYVSRSRFLNVPVASDLYRILLVEHGIEYRLFGQSWRKAAKIELLNERELAWPNWPK